MTETYRLKTIEFLGRRVPIVVQSENGPCPMLAIANIMLLRNQIHLSSVAPEVTQVMFSRQFLPLYRPLGRL